MEPPPQTAFWICTEREAVRRNPESATRRRLYLPGSEEAGHAAEAFHQLCGEEDVVYTGRTRVSESELDRWGRQIIGLARGCPGTFYEGHRTHWNTDEKFLWLYWGRSHHCYSLVITEFWELSTGRVHLPEVVRGRPRKGQGARADQWDMAPYSIPEASVRDT